MHDQRGSVVAEYHVLRSTRIQFVTYVEGETVCIPSVESNLKQQEIGQFFKLKQILRGQKINFEGPDFPIALENIRTHKFAILEVVEH